MKHHPEAVKKELECIPNSREVFNSYRELYKNSALTDIQRAAMYLYIIRTSFGSKTTTFGSKPSYVDNADRFPEISERLKNVAIENKSFEDLIKQYDRTHTLFYCDPPYFGTERLYDTGETIFDKDIHIILRDMLKSIKGKCIVSYNDDDFIRELYKDFNIEEVQRYSNLTQKQNQKPYCELIIKNY